MIILRVRKMLGVVILAGLAGVYSLGNRCSGSENSGKGHGVSHKNADGSYKYTNRLKDETSPYLLQHAHNPVDWWPWGKQAFDEARKTGKPIFLSIGYSTCYWCHVMERECFENEKIAKQMNKQFICIKVDREERPDVDGVYMAATQMLTGSGGWPMTVILTSPGAGGKDDPGLKPFWAGTYIPPVRKFGRPSLPELMDALSSAYKNKHDEVVKSAEEISGAIKASLGEIKKGGKLNMNAVVRTQAVIRKMYDKTHGGYGGKPKFPQASQLQFLLSQIGDDAQAWAEVKHCLKAMADGGINDQVGGGFHRYSTDEKWLVPHFEKMLYDQGQLVEVYLDGARIAEAKGEDSSLYKRIAREICDYVLKEMVDESGGFWSAQDAEVDALEGGNYVWTKDEAEEILKDEGEDVLRFAMAFYGFAGGTNFTDPHAPGATAVNVLYLPFGIEGYAKKSGMTVDEVLKMRDKVNAIYYAVRAKRKQPGTDDKVLTSWNGMMIAGMAEAGRVLKEPRFVTGSKRAADAILEKMKTSDGGIFRSMRKDKAKISGFLEDYSQLIHGLIEVHKASGEQKYLKQAIRLAGEVEKRFVSKGGGYFDMLDGQNDLFVRTRDSYDGATPTGNSVMIHGLIDLFEETKDRKYFDLAVKGLEAFSKTMEDQGPAVMNMLRALSRAVAIDKVAVLGGQIEAAAQAKTKAGNKVAVGVDTLSLKFAKGDAKLKVTVDVDEHWHVNAHKPGSEYLIGLKIAAVGKGFDVKVKYPKGQKMSPAGLDPFYAYEGKIELDVVVTKTADAGDTVSLEIGYQACDDGGTCLQPETIKFWLKTTD